MNERVTSPDWGLNPWQEKPLGYIHRDTCGGPAIERVLKICRDARGHERLGGCGKHYEGWVLAAERLPRKVVGLIPPKFRQQLHDDDGAVWSICDACLDKIERQRVPPVVVPRVEPRRSQRVGDAF